MNKQHLNLSIDAGLIEEAKKKYINISVLLEEALSKKIVEVEKINTGKQYQFEICDEHMTDHVKNTLFGTASIRARRCQKCAKVYFVNDPHGEFTICRNCFKNEN